MQLYPAFSTFGLIGHPCDEMAKSPAFVPPKATLEMVIGALPVLTSVMGCCGDVKVTVSVGNASASSISSCEVVDAIPNPDRLTVCVPALSAIETDALRAPVAPGLGRPFHQD